MISEIIAVGYGEKYSDEEGGYDDSYGGSAEKDKEVYATKHRVLDPGIWVENFLEEFAFLVSGYPGLVLVRIAFADACEELGFHP